MLDQSRFLAMKNLAKEVREDKQKEFKKFENDSVDEAIEKKNKLVNTIIGDLDNSFSKGDEGKEEKQIFRANLLIPDDLDFFQSYSKDKNVRNLMNKYAVSIEDVMSKITELNLYSNYIEVFNEEAKEQEKDDEFVDSMVDLSKDEADDLLDEIEDLPLPTEDDSDDGSSIVKEFFEPDDEGEKVEEPKETSKPEITEPEITEEKPIEVKVPLKKDIVDINIEEEEVPSTSPDVEISDEIENIGAAVSEFVDEYSKVKRELEFTQAKVDKFNTEKEDLRKKLNMSKDENEALTKENDGLRNDVERFYQQTRKLNDEKISLQNKVEEAASEITRITGEKVKVQEELDKVIYEAEKLASENDTLKAKMASMEETVRQSTALLKEIYKTIPKKRFNVK